MRGMNSESVDLIYLDPPFKSDANYAAPIGSVAAGAEFKDTWGLDELKIAWHGLIKSEHPSLYSYLAAVKNINSPSMMAYLIYMAVRLMEMKRLLKSYACIYLHCNQFASHYLKLLMDSIFGKKNFVNEIIWNYGTPSGGRTGGKKPVKVHDCILVYAKNYGKHLYNIQHTPYSEKYVRDWFRHTDEEGREFQTRSRKGTIVRQYLDESPGMPLSTVWSDIMQLSSRRGWFPGSNKEETGYPTQKPLALLERIIKASSNENDVVFDPFCGCATTCVSADALNRQWVGVDISPKAAELVRLRINDLTRTIINRADVPQRTDLEHIRRYNHPENKERLYGKQSGHCNACNEHFQSRHLEIDHIQPQSKGGTDHIDNLQLLCGSCNRIKGNRTQEYLMAILNDKDIIKFAA